ncbi:MAG: RNA polymerase-binding ATPase [Gammaproteobacteria bacterium]|nr:RNA polymerase-binding ATPase [Gammaproteobacteria bacterium]
MSQTNKLKDFAPGQRWISDTEPDLGLGMVTETDHRTVTFDFSAVDESRRYARDAAPLTRLVLNVGDPLQLGEVKVEITGIDVTAAGTINYQVRMPEGDVKPLPETLLPDNLSMNRPLDRLMSGQFDPAHWFHLKQQSLALLGQAQASGLMGLCSARAELIPHQLYIADEVARRYAPRVMLADEVGLGKTIEAGLILQQQLVSGLCQRVLIIVPEPLLHQWLVEMLRRFNLHFTVLDAERCQALTDSGESDPFSSTQLALCPMSLFTDSPGRIEQAENAGWDLAIVDEAHHVELGAEQEADPAYLALSRLAAASKGLLLLTATPEQLGHKNHFALLRLLDPARFNDYAAFVSEQQHYQDIVSKISRLDRDSAKVRELLDQHGTGRILFRNTRRGLTGFPARKLNAWPVAAADDQADNLQAEGLEHDPRVQWLVQWLHENHDGKVLLICAHDALAMALEKHLRLRVGIRSSVFHRHMSLLERDRAAAYFAGDSGDAARILVCSEIGSEGRNFQFCRHLVLFDLPTNPDLLEQRIGRLDRIGQQHDIEIHVPYVRGSRQEVLFRWYHEALNAFAQVSRAAYRLYHDLQPQLQAHLDHADADSAAFRTFLADAAQQNDKLQQDLEQGRDQLLELNSFNADRAAELLHSIRQFEKDCSPQDWLLSVLDSYSVYYDQNSDGSVSIIPGEDMLLPVFPGLPDEGFEACFQRRHALSREDRVFLSWQHPMITGAMDLIIDSHQGKAAASVYIDEHGWPAPRSPIILQCLYRVKVSAPAHLQLAKYLPATSLTLTVALNHRDEAARVTLADNIGDALRHPNKAATREFMQEHQKTLQSLLTHANLQAAKQCQATIDQASQRMLASQTGEIKRLLALKANNPNIRQEEIDYLKEQTLALHQCLGKAEAELVAIHLIINPKQE